MSQLLHITLDAFRRFARRYTIPWPKSFDALFNLVEMYVPYYHPTCHFWSGGSA
jgi:hypothetical protein